MILHLCETVTGAGVFGTFHFKNKNYLPRVVVVKASEERVGRHVVPMSM